MKVKVFVPNTKYMSAWDVIVSDKPMESWQEEALWHYNKSREHDGLPPINRFPNGTKHEVLNIL